MVRSGKKECVQIKHILQINSSYTQKDWYEPLMLLRMNQYHNAVYITDYKSWYFKCMIQKITAQGGQDVVCPELISPKLEFLGVIVVQSHAFS